MIDNSENLDPGRWIICLLPRLLFYFRRAALGRRHDHADVGATRGPIAMP